MNELHVATHGFFLQDVPLVAPPDFSNIIFSGTRSASLNTGKGENPLLRSGLALAGANPRSEALRQTQLEMLQNPQSQHPYYWAAFIPSGDWTPMEF